MGRSSLIVRWSYILIAVSLIAGLSGCSSTSPTTATNFPTPANISLSPANPVSLDAGAATQNFTATPRNSSNTAITTPVTFLSSNTAVLTIAANGLACAGTWDSLTAPQICTPGPVGTAQVTARSHGVSSPPTTVYVHQHIDKIMVSPVTGQTPPAGPCFSRDQSFNYQASAFSRGLDITGTVGPFTWQSVNIDVTTLAIATDSAPVPGLVTGQIRVTAHTPGITSLVASNGNVNSQPLDFTTCAVQSITLAVTGSTSNSINVTAGSGKTATATVVDTQGNTITGVPLTWSSSNPQSVSSEFRLDCHSPGRRRDRGCFLHSANLQYWIQAAAADLSGGRRRCSGRSCRHHHDHHNHAHGLRIEHRIFFLSSRQLRHHRGMREPAGSHWFTQQHRGYGSRFAGNAELSGFRPPGRESLYGYGFFIFRKPRTDADHRRQPPTVSQFKSVTGKVLTVSPDGKKVILSGANPNAVPVPGSNTPPPATQVIVFDTTSNTGTTLNIAGATAADFSPDSLRAFIAAGSNLYVWSAQDALKKISLTAPARDVSFSPEGAFAFVAGGSSSSSVTAWSTCGLNSALTNNVVLPSVPLFLKALPRDAVNLADPPTAGSATTITSVLAVDSPGIDLFRVARAPTGCASTASSGTATPFNLGQGGFVPIQLIVSQDAARAYVLASDRGSVLVFNIDNQTSSAIPLSGGAVPIQASLTPDGSRLYIAAADGQVHILDTQNGGDILQISFPTDPTTFQAGLCSGVPFTCNPDLIAVKP